MKHKGFRDQLTSSCLSSSVSMGGGRGDVEGLGEASHELDLSLAKVSESRIIPIAKTPKGLEKLSLCPTFMTQVFLWNCSPKYLAPHTPIIGHDAAWTHTFRQSS